MKLTSVELHPAGSASIGVLSFRDPGRANPYNVKSIVGLDADEIVARFYGGSGGDTKFYNLSIEKRNVVVQISLNPRFNLGESYSSLRDELYKMVASSRSGLIQLQFKNGTNVVAAISGFVTKLEAPQFEKSQTVQLTVKCDDPMLRALDPVSVDVAGLIFGHDISYNRFSAGQASGEDSVATYWSSVTNVPNNPTDGLRAFRIAPGGLGVTFAQIATPFTVVAGEEFTFSLDLTPSHSGRTLAICIKYMDAADIPLAETNTAWVTEILTARRSHTLTVPVGAVKAVPYLAYSSLGGGETVDFDSAAFRLGTEDTYSEPGTNGNYLVDLSDDLSTAPHGFSFELAFTANAPTLSIYDSEASLWDFTIRPVGGFLNSDVLHFSSEYNNKYLYIVRGGNKIHLSDVIDPGSVWPIIFPGDNQLAITSAIHLVFNAISYYPTYWGV